MLIPQYVKVGNFIYDVKESEEPLILDNLVCDGLCDSYEQIIQLNAKLNHQSKERVFLHELIHAIVFDKELDFGENLEYVVDSLAKGLHSVIVDNYNIFAEIDLEDLEELEAE